MAELDNFEVVTFKGNVDAKIAFGWTVKDKKSETHRSGKSSHRSTTYVLARDVRMDHYSDLKSLEASYYAEDNAIDRDDYSIDPETALILFAILIIPGIIYCIAKKSKQKEVEAINDQHRAQMDSLLKKARALSGQ